MTWGVRNRIASLDWGRKRSIQAAVPGAALLTVSKVEVCGSVEAGRGDVRRLSTWDRIIERWSGATSVPHHTRFGGMCFRFGGRRRGAGFTACAPAQETIDQRVLVSNMSVAEVGANYLLHVIEGTRERP